MSLVKRFERNIQGIDWVIGDLHGHHTRFLKVLAAIGFDGSKDRMFSVGDLTDRGPESEELLRYFDQEPWAHAALGNHEWMLVQYHECHAVLDVEKYIESGGSWAVTLPEEIRQELVDIVYSMPIAIDVDTPHGRVGIIHADVLGNSWEHTVYFLEKFPTIMYPSHMHFFWDRDRILFEREEPVVGIDKLIVGHTPVKHPMRLANVLDIDTGGWRSFDMSPILTFTLYNMTDDEIVTIDFDKDM